MAAGHEHEHSAATALMEAVPHRGNIAGVAITSSVATFGVVMHQLLVA